MGGSTLVLPLIAFTEVAMAATTTTTLKLPQNLKTRIARVARKTGRTAHGFMIEAIERQTAREERLEAFAKEALAADRAIEQGGEVYAAEDVHAWLDRLASGGKTARPKPWRG
jgi:predicted transcriptional regulator